MAAPRIETIMENPAAAAIEIIKDEHRSMGAVVKALQARVAAVKAGTESLDVYLLRAMLDYIELMPDRIHHPKEDEYLFRILRQRSAEAARVLEELEAEHIRARELLAALRSALESVRGREEMGALDRALESYADFLWQHMRREEDVVLPLAERALNASDWQTIAAAFQANRNLMW
jgi:hemerythrin-like domain-containing protein